MPEFDPKPTRRWVLDRGCGLDAAGWNAIGRGAAGRDGSPGPELRLLSGLGAAPAESRISDQGPGNQRPRCGEDTARRSGRSRGLPHGGSIGLCDRRTCSSRSRSSVFLPTSRTRPALRCPACRSAPPVWRAASRRLTRSSCSGRAAVAPICVSLGRRRLIEAVAQTGLKRNEVANLFAPCGHCQRVQRASVDRVPGQQRVGQLHRLFITLEALVRELELARCQRLRRSITPLRTAPSIRSQSSASVGESILLTAHSRAGPRTYRPCFPAIGCARRPRLGTASGSDPL